ncbi:MAG TPA: pilus assembly protein N-terminal domain-containing protein [Parvularculaceae bacterium]|nr:pilus assembly protein N-terminal domain-containing protein [Parvularculaceae bacterium]
MRVLIAAAALSLAAGTAHAGEIWLTMDQVRPYTLEKPAGQIVVGNPAIADVTVQDKTRVLLFGKAPGLTNMYIFDDAGTAIDNLIVRVNTGGANMLTMHRGASRVTYSCAAQCEPTQTVGDDNTIFSNVGTQVTQKQAQAAASQSSN